MIRITNLKDYYEPLQTYNNGKTVKIAFDYEPLFNIDEYRKASLQQRGTWAEHIFSKKPSLSQIKDFILTEINKRTDELILSGFTWKNRQVWLSTENQFNYKAAYDLAIQTNGENLPQVFKFGSTEHPKYYKFETVEELSDFYTKASVYVNQCLAVGWAKKDSIDWNLYDID